MIYKVGSLFAGVGGICLGFNNASNNNNNNYQLVWANEIDSYACETYRNNFSHEMIQGDIEKIVRPEREASKELRNEYICKRDKILNQKIDILTGGFPCQAFSIAGYRKGFDDHRGNLFWSIVDLINLLEEKHGPEGKPKVIFLENVKNLKTHENGETYGLIKNELEKLNYTVKEHVLNTMDYSELPQNRERIYIVCFLNENIAKEFSLFDNLEKYKTNYNKQERIKSILDLNLSKDDIGKYYYTKEKYPHYFLSESEYNNINPDIRKENRINIEEEITEEYQFYQIRRGMYVRKNQSGVCPTLTANMGTGGHNVPIIKVKDGIRKLTPSETFKLQGFPIGNGYTLPNLYNGRKFPDGNLYKQSGNAVSVDIITLIAKEILVALDKADR